MGQTFTDGPLVRTPHVAMKLAPAYGPIELCLPPKKMMVPFHRAYTHLVRLCKERVGHCFSKRFEDGGRLTREGPVLRQGRFDKKTHQRNVEHVFNTMWATQ